MSQENLESITKRFSPPFLSEFFQSAENIFMYNERVRIAYHTGKVERFWKQNTESYGDNG